MLSACFEASTNTTSLVADFMQSPWPARHAVGAGLTRTLGTTQGVFGGPQSVHEYQDPAARLALLQRSGKDRSASGPFRSTQWGYRSVDMPYQASFGSAERVELLAHGREVHEKVSSLYRRRASRCSSVTLLRRRLEGNCQGQLNRPRQNQVCSRKLWQLEPVLASSMWQVVPNTSFKPSPNGVPRGPGWRYAVHFRHPGPRVTPLVPA